VTISAPFGRPSAARGGGGGGGAGRWAAVAFSWVAVAADRSAAFRVAADVLGTAGFVAATDDLVAATDDFVPGAFEEVAECDLVVRRSAPRRVGRVERRLPSTLASAPDFALFFDFFLDDFCVMDTVNEWRRAPSAFDFKKYSA
jgi:hypothetical protein